MCTAKAFIPLSEEQFEIHFVIESELYVQQMERTAYTCKYEINLRNRHEICELIHVAEMKRQYAFFPKMPSQLSSPFKPHNETIY